MKDLDRLALAMPEATKHVEDDGRPTTGPRQVLLLPPQLAEGRCRPETGERLTDVLVFRVADAGEKEAILRDDRGIFFTTPHWDGYSAVLLRIRDLKQVDRDELRDLVAGAWLTRAQKRVAKAWLAEQGIDED